ncbi:MAG: multicopper oxidase domain-containing protein [Candidatus Omnitrophica bacterium]|nr:multicopper oxidase domain-containing protein [Candidatus Omnitrophota bacterium]
MVKRYVVFVLTVLFFTGSTAFAKTVEYELTLEARTVNITGRDARAMTINGGIPGPVLRFRKGDIARILVHNKMDVDTSIHWHGLLVPPDMDGVPYVTFPPIKAHSTFTYEFPIRQTGTYWYHSHTRLQEQKGVYGAFVIEDEDPPGYDREYTIVLSDWTNEDPHEVLRTLKRGSHWFTVQKGSAQSFFGALKAGMLRDYLKRELQRMPVMDIADVAYDRFLANGKPEIFLDAGPGDTVRIRMIDGSASTFFHINYAGGPLEVISADGIRVEPVKLDRFLIGVAETYDILVTVPAEGMYELRATAHDASGYSSVWIGSGEKHAALAIPPPNMYESMGKLSLKKIFAFTPAGSMGMPDRAVKKGMFDEPGMMGGMNHGMSHKKAMDPGEEGGHMFPGKAKSYTGSSTPPERNGKKFGRDFIPMAPDISSRGNLVPDGSAERPWPPYKKLRAAEKTAFDPDLPVREIRLTLDGDMERYVWFINNQPLSARDTIRVRGGEVTRFVMINRTMMHHPMHLHGQFFRVVNGQGDYAPLKHTVDVPPMSTTVIEFDGSETGDWFFHCHLLYHMESGMARVVHYEGFSPSAAVQKVRDNLYKEKWYAWMDVEALSNMTEGVAVVSDTRNIFKAEWEVGWGKVEHIKWESALMFERYIDRFLTIFAGVDFEGEESDFTREVGVFGAHYVLPFNLVAGAWVDTRGDWRFMLEREIALTPRLEMFGKAEYDTGELWEGKAGLSYRINKRFSVLAQWHSEYGWGGGGRIEF